MEDFDHTYHERNQIFMKGAQNGQSAAQQEKLQEITQQAHQFGTELAEELGTYQAYIEVFEELGISDKFPILKVNDIVGEMKTLVKELDFCSLEVLKSQRESLRRLYQVLKAMTGIKKGVEMRRKQEEHYDF